MNQEMRGWGPGSDSCLFEPFRAIDPLEGEVLYTDSRVYARIPAIIIFGQLTLLVLWMWMMALGGLIWMIALIRYWAGSRSSALKLSGYPTFASVLFFATALLIFFSRNQTDVLAEPGALSLTIMAMSVWFALSAG